jgi:hypothetical protein
MLTPEAQQIVGRDRFETLMQSDLREGLGAFADATDFHHVVIESEGPRARVVGIVAGEVTREASTENAAMAISILVQGDEVLIDDGIVDRTSYYDRIAVFASSSLGPQSFRRGDELIVELTNPQGAQNAVIALDGGGDPLETEFDAASGRIAATLERDLEAGSHIAIVVVVAENGRLYPEAIVFQAAAPQ